MGIALEFFLDHNKASIRLKRSVVCERNWGST